MSSLFSTFSMLLSHLTVEVSIVLWNALCLGMEMIIRASVYPSVIDPSVSLLAIIFISLDRKYNARRSIRGRFDLNLI